MKKRIIKDDSEKKEIIVRNIFIGLLIINLIVNFLSFPAMTYNNSDFHQIVQLYSNILNSGLFIFFLWAGSILTYVVGFFYLVLVLESKKEILLKLMIIIIGILYTPILINIIMNFLSRFFYTYG